MQENCAYKSLLMFLCSLQMWKGLRKEVASPDCVFTAVWIGQISQEVCAQQITPVRLTRSAPDSSRDEQHQSPGKDNHRCTRLDMKCTAAKHKPQQKVTLKWFAMLNEGCSPKMIKTKFKLRMLLFILLLNLINIIMKCATLHLWNKKQRLESDGRCPHSWCWNQIQQTLSFTYKLNKFFK